MSISRTLIPRGLTLSTAVLRLLSVSLAAAPASAAPAALWTAYIQNPDTHPNVPNCSYAGYRYGEDPIPDIAGPVFDVTAAAYGATADDANDDTGAVRAALAAAKANGGGVVYFPAGTFLVGGILFVHSDNTVVRGAGEGLTVIRFTQALDDAYGTADSVVNGTAITKWSYTGGLVWFGPEERGNTYRSGAPGRMQGDPLQSGEYDETWLTTGTEHAINANASRGASSVTLATSDHGISAGDFVLLRQSDPGDYSMVRHFAGGGAWANAYPWVNPNPGTDDGGASWQNPNDLEWVVEVAAVSGSTLTFRQPLRFDVKAVGTPDWNASITRMGRLLRNSGIEHLTLEFARAYTWDDTSHHVEHGWNAPHFNNAVHCWLRNVTMVDMESGPSLTAAKCVTLTGFTLTASAADREAHHHGTITRQNSHDNLIQNFLIESRPFHGLNIESLSTGNVWRAGQLDHGSLDIHRREPFENIRTDITFVANDGNRGGSGGPAMGARFTNWNLRSPSGAKNVVGWGNFMPFGAIVGLQGAAVSFNISTANTPAGQVTTQCVVEGTGTEAEPADLHAAQLAHRFASNPVVLADAIVDNQDPAPRTASAGTWFSSITTPGYHGANYQHDNNENVGSKTKTFSFKPALPWRGDYEIRLRWPAGSNRATNVPVEIVTADGTLVAVVVDQTQNSNQWVLLGTWPLSPSDAEIKIKTVGTTGYVMADAVKVTPLSVIVDNTDPQASATGAWATSSTTPGFYGADYRHDNKSAKGSKSFTFRPALPRTGNYRVYLRWTSGGNRATNVPVDIATFDGSVATAAPVDQSINGGAWNLLGAWTLSPANAAITIRTTGTSTDRYVIADAVKLVPVSP